MNARGRRLILGLALLVCLILVGWWLRPGEAPVSAPLPVDASDIERPLVQEAQPAESGVESVAPASASSTFRGRVIDAMTRQPVREFELAFAEWNRSARGPEPPGPRKFSTTDGRFEWPSLPPGLWTMTAAAAGYQRFALTDLRLVEGKATPEIVVPLSRGYTLRGRSTTRHPTSASHRQGSTSAKPARDASTATGACGRESKPARMGRSRSTACLPAA